MGTTAGRAIAAAILRTLWIPVLCLAAGSCAATLLGHEVFYIGGAAAIVWALVIALRAATVLESKE